VELVHPADVLVGDPAGELDLIAEAVNGFFVDGDIRVESTLRAISSPTSLS